MFLKIAQKGFHPRTICYLKLLLMVAFCLTQGIQTCAASGLNEKKTLLDDSRNPTSYSHHSSLLDEMHDDTVVDFSTTTTTQAITIPPIEQSLLTPPDVAKGTDAWIELVKFLKLNYEPEEYNRLLTEYGNDFEKKYEEDKKNFGGGFEKFKKEKVENAWQSKQDLQAFLGGLKRQVQGLQPLVQEQHTLILSQAEEIQKLKQQLAQKSTGSSISTEMDGKEAAPNNGELNFTSEEIRQMVADINNLKEIIPEIKELKQMIQTRGPGGGTRGGMAPSRITNKLTDDPQPRRIKLSKLGQMIKKLEFQGLTDELAEKVEQAVTGIATSGEVSDDEKVAAGVKELKDLELAPIEITKLKESISAYLFRMGLAEDATKAFDFLMDLGSLSINDSKKLVSDALKLKKEIEKADEFATQFGRKLPDSVTAREISGICTKVKLIFYPPAETVGVTHNFLSPIKSVGKQFVADLKSTMHNHDENEIRKAVNADPNANRLYTNFIKANLEDDALTVAYAYLVCMSKEALTPSKAPVVKRKLNLVPQPVSIIQEMKAREVFNKFTIETVEQNELQSDVEKTENHK